MLIDSSLAVLIGAGAATTGWLYTARRSRTLAKKQHTINVILQTNFNKEFLDSRAAIAPHLKNGSCPDDVINGANDELRRHFRNILNHYEFVSAGLRNGDFEEKLVKDSERGTYIALYRCCEKYIWSVRDSRKRMTIYEHLEWIHNRWEAKPPGRIQRTIERVRGRPFYGKVGK